MTPTTDLRRIELGIRQPPGLTEKIEAAIKRLGNDSYQEREKAVKELAAMGAPAYVPSYQAAKSKDAEVARPRYLHEPRSGDLGRRAQAGLVLAEPSGVRPRGLRTDQREPGLPKQLGIDRDAFAQLRDQGVHRGFRVEAESLRQLLFQITIHWIHARTARALRTLHS